VTENNIYRPSVCPPIASGNSVKTAKDIIMQTMLHDILWMPEILVKFQWGQSIGGTKYNGRKYLRLDK